MTPAEAFLWRYIKNKQIEGARFRRQFSVENYILDFYCFEYKIAVELDGQGHFTEEGKKSDEERTNELTKHGVKIIRFENVAVFTYTEMVLADIREEVLKAKEITKA